MQINIGISHDIFYKSSSLQNIDLNIPKPTHIKWNYREKIDEELVGVYVVFDMYDDEEDEDVEWCTPNPCDLSGKSRKCLYVGEGKIKTRLNVNKDYYGYYAGEVIYYEIPVIEDRLLFEKILIKHYQPIFNKQNYSYPSSVVSNYGASLDKIRNHLINEINGKAENEELSLDAKAFFYHLYDNLNWSLEYIQNIINLHSMDNITQEVETYHNEMVYFSKLNTKSSSS